MIAMDRHTNVTSGFVIATPRARRNITARNTSGIALIKSDNPSDSLCHLDDVKSSQGNRVSETSNVDTCLKDAVMKDDEFSVIFFTPRIEGFKKLFTVDFLVVDICSKFRGNVEDIITTIFQLKE